MTPLLLVLDLDETLLYSTLAPLERPADLRVGPFFTYFRPGSAAFIRGAREHHTLAVWTASTRSYAEPIVDALFGAPASLAFFYCADRCSHRYDPERMQQMPVKKLARVKRLGFSMARTLHVDNTPSTYSQNYGNGVPIRYFSGETSDRELEGLAAFLATLRDVADVRPIEKRRWWYSTPQQFTTKANKA